LTGYIIVAYDKKGKLEILEKLHMNAVMLPGADTEQKKSFLWRDKQ